MQDDTENQFEKEIAELKGHLYKAVPVETDDASIVIASMMVAAEAHSRLQDPNMLAFLSLATAVYQLQLEAQSKTTVDVPPDAKE
jgi:hypothetical protein